MGILIKYSYVERIGAGILAGRNLVPMTDNESDLGSPTKRWRDIYVTNIAGYYNKGNVVGTVSQSDGVPTGAVIERGSNANGEYVKFSDGTMICSILKTVTDQAINSTYGSLYTGTRTWTFPAVFVDSPVVTASSAKWGTGAAWAITDGVSSVESATLRFFDVVSRSTGTNFIYSASAIGRWF